MIKIKSLSYQYPQSTQKVLDHVTLEIPPGTLTLVTGASGSGKSTLLRCLNGLVPHFTGGKISGQIEVFGSDPIALGVEGMAAKVGYVFQEPEVQFVFDIVEDEIAFALENYAVPRSKMEQRISNVVKALGLSHLRKKQVNQISGGEQQKVAIASALVLRPQVLILDEPTSQLDPLTADEFLNFVIKLKTQLNLTVLISEHRLERLLSYADLMINLSDDKGIIYGHPQQVLPSMDQVPPIIKIGRKLNLTPLPLTPSEFPNLNLAADPEIIAIDHDFRNNDTVLEILHLTTRFNGNTILKDINLQIHHREILVLMGPNGAGKTTLLRSILKLIPSSGDMVLDGASVKELHSPAIIEKIAYLPQNPNDLLFADSISDELLITLRNHNLDPEKVNIAQFLKYFNLTDKASLYPRDLSVGERQRTALAAITVHQPHIILLDEPTRGLDYNAKGALSDLFHHWRSQGKTIILVTHDVEFAAQLADRVVILEKGEIVFNGSPQEGFSNYPVFQTQTAQLFPGTGWIRSEDFPNISKLTL